MTAPASGETSPIEAAARTARKSRTGHNWHLVNPETQANEIRVQRDAAEALLAGDWLERVLHDHQVVKRQYVHDVNDTMFTLCTCDTLVPDGPGYDSVKPFIAHQAAAVVAYATGAPA